MRIPWLLLPVLSILASASGFGQTIPDEMAVAKAKFLKRSAQLNSALPDDLNGKYAAEIERTKKTRQTEGDLEAVLSMTAELEALKKTGKPGVHKVDPNSDIGKLRKTYRLAFLGWNNQRVDKFEALKRGYIKELEALTTKLTKAGRIEEALLVRNGVNEVQKLRVGAIGGSNVNSAMETALGNAELSAGNRAGRVRGFGKLMASALDRNGATLDFSVFEKYDDIVDVSGNHISILLRRKNGEVLDFKGEVVGRNAAKLITTGDYGGYLDDSGNFHTAWQGEVPPEAQPMQTMQKFFYRRVALKTTGEVVGWGGVYSDGRRKVIEKAKQDIKQIGVFDSVDYALSEDGNLYCWDGDGEVEVPAHIRTGVKQISIQGYAGFVLGRDDRVYWLDGQIAPMFRDKALKVVTRGEFSAFLRANDQRWEAHAYNKTAMGNELDVLNLVLNRKETIDVAFYLQNSKNSDPKTKASYVIWIEEVGAPTFDVTDATELRRRLEGIAKPVSTSTGSRGGFFGVEFE